MTNEWHYTLDGQLAAIPVSAVQLKQLAAAGQLKPTDLVWQDGMLEWAPASSVKGLFPAGKNLGDSAIVPPASAKTPVGTKTIKMRTPRDWTNIHPLLVFVLTILTVGLFGLFYAYQVCRAFRLRTVARTSDAAGRKLGTVHHPFGVLLLSYLTLGFYFFYWAYRALGECNDYLGLKDVNPRAELSLMLIFPPYALYVTTFVLPEQIRRVQTLGGVPESPGLRHAVLFFLPSLIFGLPLLAMICQDALNQLWTTTP